MLIANPSFVEIAYLKLYRLMVPRGGIEPPTQGFSEYYSTKILVNKGFAGVS